MFSRKEYAKQWYQDNKEKIKQKVAKQHAEQTLPYHIVYLLPEHNYVGVTNQPERRMITHKNKQKRNTNGWIELARYENRKDALIHESKLHSQGYNGAIK
jgi:hypothetical protein